VTFQEPNVPTDRISVVLAPLWCELPWAGVEMQRIAFTRAVVEDDPATVQYQEQTR